MIENEIDLNALALLAEIDRQGGYAPAAERLGLSNATASRRIVALERAIGVTLLERSARYVRLTAAGAQLLTGVAAPLSSIERAIEETRSAREEVAGLVRIATTATLADLLLAPVLAPLRAAHPSLGFEILLDEEVIDIRKHRIDFALRGGDARDYSAVARKLTRHRFSCWTTPHWASREDAPRLAYDRELQGDARTVAVTARDVALLKRLVLDGLGEAWLPDLACAEEAASGALIRRADREEHWFDIFVVYPSRRDLTHRARLVVDALFAAAKPLEDDNQ